MANYNFYFCIVLLSFLYALGLNIVKGENFSNINFFDQVSVGSSALSPVKKSNLETKSNAQTPNNLEEEENENDFCEAQVALSSLLDFDMSPKESTLNYILEKLEAKGSNHMACQHMKEHDDLNLCLRAQTNSTATGAKCGGLDYDKKVTHYTNQKSCMNGLILGQALISDYIWPENSSALDKWIIQYQKGIEDGAIDNELKSIYKSSISLMKNLRDDVRKILNSFRTKKIKQIWKDRKSRMVGLMCLIGEGNIPDLKDQLTINDDLLIVKINFEDLTKHMIKELTYAFDQFGYFISNLNSNGGYVDKLKAIHQDFHVYRMKKLAPVLEKSPHSSTVLNPKGIIKKLPHIENRAMRKMHKKHPKIEEKPSLLEATGKLEESFQPYSEGFIPASDLLVQQANQQTSNNWLSSNYPQGFVAPQNGQQGPTPTQIGQQGFAPIQSGQQGSNPTQSGQQSASPIQNGQQGSTPQNMQQGFGATQGGQEVLLAPQNAQQAINPAQVAPITPYTQKAVAPTPLYSGKPLEMNPKSTAPSFNSQASIGLHSQIIEQPISMGSNSNSQVSSPQTYTTTSSTAASSSTESGGSNSTASGAQDKEMSISFAIQDTLLELNIFKVDNNTIIGETDTDRVKKIVESSFLDIKDTDCLLKLFLGPQAALVNIIQLFEEFTPDPIIDFREWYNKTMDEGGQITDGTVPDTQGLNMTKFVHRFSKFMDMSYQNDKKNGLFKLDNLADLSMKQPKTQTQDNLQGRPGLVEISGNRNRVLKDEILQDSSKSQDNSQPSFVDAMSKSEVTGTSAPSIALMSSDSGISNESLVKNLNKENLEVTTDEIFTMEGSDSHALYAIKISILILSATSILFALL